MSSPPSRKAGASSRARATPGRQRCPNPACRAQATPGLTVCWQCGGELDPRSRGERQPLRLALELLAMVVALKAACLLLGWAVDDFQPAYFLLFAGTFGAALFMAARASSASPARGRLLGAVGLGAGAPRGTLAPALITLIGGLVAWAGAGQVVDLWLRATPLVQWRAQLSGALFQNAGAARAVFGVFTGCVLGALAEETCFRGVGQRLVAARFSPHVAAWGVAVAWSLWWLDPLSVIPLLFLGAALGYVAAYAGSLWPCIGAHFLYSLYVFRMGTFRADFSRPLGDAGAGTAFLALVLGVMLMAGGVAWLAAQSLDEDDLPTLPPTGDAPLLRAPGPAGSARGSASRHPRIEP